MLMIYNNVRYIDFDHEDILEEILYLLQSKFCTNSEHIFDPINSYLKKLFLKKICEKKEIIFSPTCEEIKSE